MNEGVETATHLILQAQREDGTWYETMSSQWRSEAEVRAKYDTIARDQPIRLVRRETTVTVTETVVS